MGRGDYGNRVHEIDNGAITNRENGISNNKEKDTSANMGSEKVELNTDSDTRETWGNQVEFFLSCLGYAVGFGNVWRFPYLAYENGGAVFLIPYIIMLFCAGLPLFFMELALGQYVSLGPNILFPKLALIFSGLGWAMIVVSTLVAIYYNIILAWTIFYTIFSFTTVLPWSHCSNDFNSIGCFTDEVAQNCQLNGTYFFNKECSEVQSICENFGLLYHNKTFCTNGTTFMPIETVSQRISASEDFFRNRMLHVEGKTWENMGSMRWELVGCLALAWIIVCACMIKGVKSSGKVVYFTALFPYAVLFILFIRGVTLDGAMKGIRFYLLEPQFEKLLEIKVWNAAATQIFYSLGSSFGGLITLASYNKFKNNCMRDAILIAFCNCATSIFAGFVIFCILGFMATQAGVEVGDVVRSGSGLAFIAYPEAVTKIPGSPFWALLFFFMLITLGLDSQFTMVETLTTAIFDRFTSLRSRKPLIVIGMCFLLFIFGLVMCLEGGIFMFELFNGYSAGLSVVILAIFEIVAVQYIYGFKRFLNGIQNEMGIHIPKFLYAYWTTTWLVVTPLSLVIIFIWSIKYWTDIGFGEYIFPKNIQTLGWFMCSSSFVLVPLFAIYEIVTNKKTFLDLFKPSPEFCPKHKRNILKAEAVTSEPEAEGRFRYIYDNDGFQEGAVKIYPTIQQEPPAPYTQHM